MALSEQEIRQLTDEIVRKLSGIRPRMDDPAERRASVKAEENGWLWDTADQAVRAAKAAQAQLAALTLEKRGELISAMRKTAVENAEHIVFVLHHHRLVHAELGVECSLSLGADGFFGHEGAARDKAHQEKCYGGN